MCKMKNNFNMKNADHNLRISNFFTQRRSQDTLRHLRWISLQKYLKAKNCQLLLQSSSSQVFVRIMILLSNPDYVSFFAFFFLQKSYIVFLSYNLIDVRQIVQKIWKFSPSILTIFSDFLDFLIFSCYKGTNGASK